MAPTRQLMSSNSIPGCDLNAGMSPTSRPTGTTYDSGYTPLDSITSRADDTPTALPPYRDDQNDVARPEQISKSKKLEAKLCP